ncbi:ABC transporter ATP-binding protein [Halorhabdus sp. CBA1104]|uniref:ABC transporter ATP-binding protein n=1 Tax=Halorhabdus sp. CBA1104 TaxID=1380432 RepID=UPI0018A6BC8F|nr:ABC transporter ATP-binding protein [Halorhabdus sp. CBA1104]
MTLELAGLETAYEGFALGPLSLTVPDGVTAVLGPSGAGKSTVLELIAGFESPAMGTITLNGARIDQVPPENRDVGMVFQDAALFPHLSVEANLRFGAPAGADIDETVSTLAVGDLLSRDPTTLSGGERQRVALARTLVTDPDALLLDEPLSSLDAPIRRRLRLDLRDVLAGLDIPVVYVTHDQDEAAIVGDRLAVIIDGEIRQEGAIEAVFDAPATPAVARFLGVANLIEGTVIERTDGRTTVDIGPTTLSVPIADDGEPLHVTVGVRPDAITVQQQTAQPNALSVRVERVFSQHAAAIVVATSDDVGPLRATVDESTAAALTPGQRCSFVLAPEQIHLFPAEHA